MTPDTQFFPSAYQIGDLIPMGDQGDLVTMPNGEQRLMTGKVASAADFPDAAVEETTKVTGIAVATFPSGAVMQCASNGSGSVVAAVGVPNINQSQDFGATWSSTSPGGGGVNCSGMVWTGSAFVAGVAQASTMSFRSSATGESWSSAGTVTSVSATGNSLRGAYNGTIAFFVGCGTVDAAATVNTAGTTVTGRTLPVSLGGSTPLIASVAGLFAYSASNTATYYTTPDGVAFTTRSAPFNFTFMAATSTLLGIYQSSTGRFATTPDGINWTEHSAIRGFGNSLSAMTADVSRFYISGGYTATRPVPWLRWSTNGVAWTNRWLSSAPVAEGAWGMCSGRVLYPMIEAGTSVLMVADFDDADYVGVSQLYTTAETGGAGDSTSAIYYVKVGES